MHAGEDPCGGRMMEVKRCAGCGGGMNISSRCDYACRAMVELAKQHDPEGPVTAMYIAEARGIPDKYLVHILLQLKRAKLLTSVRGAQGGYLLGRPPDQITLLDIVQAIDGPIMDPLPVEENGNRDLALAWRKIAGSIEELLGEVSLHDVIERAASPEMYYI